MEKTLSLKDLYAELEANPDLRRLGKYKVTLDPGKPILPIDINLEGKDIHLGDGDYRDVFVAFGETKARTVDLGSCAFTDLYLDYLDTDSLVFSESKASRLFFDYAKVENCEFRKFASPEVYFDLAEIQSVKIQELNCSIVYLAKLQAGEVIYDGELAKDYEFAVDEGGTTTFGNYVAPVLEEKTSDRTVESEIRHLTADEFLEELKMDPDLTRLGKYQIKPTDESAALEINMEMQDGNLNFGDGDFSLLPVSFGNSSMRNVELGKSTFSELNLGASTIEKIDFSKSQIGWLHFGSCDLGDCFFSDFYGFKISSDNAQVKNIFGQRGNVKEMHLGSMNIGQFNINHLKAEELHLGESVIREMYMSNGTGIERLFCDECEIWLLNMHEASLKELDFEHGHIVKALINKCSAETVQCDELEADLLYIGNDGKNKFGTVDFAELKGVEHLEIGEMLPRSGEKEEEWRQTFKELKFK